MTLDLKSIRAEADAATPGPWCFSEDSPLSHRFRVETGTPNDDEDSPLPMTWDNAAFIASARTTVPLLLDLAEAQAAEIADWKSRADDYYRIGKHWAELVDTLRAEIAELRAAVASAGFRVSPCINSAPTLWCVECGRDSGFHWEKCARLRSRMSEAVTPASEVAGPSSDETGARAEEVGPIRKAEQQVVSAARLLTKNMPTRAQYSLRTVHETMLVLAVDVLGAAERAERVEPNSAAGSVLTPAGGGSDEPELSKTSGIAKDSPGGTQQPSPEGSPVDPALSSEARVVDRCSYVRGEMRDGALLPVGRCALATGHDGAHFMLDLDATGGIRAERIEPALVCRCSQIQADDPRRHFKGCPMREELPEMAPPSGEPKHSSKDDVSEYEELQELRAANATLRKALDVRTEYHTFVQQRDEARIKATELGDILRDLVYTLPRCDNHPDRPATRAWVRGAGRYCDECGTKVGMLPVHEYPRAAAVRKAQALLEKEGRR
jgi:hypothetical protein